MVGAAAAIGPADADSVVAPPAFVAVTSATSEKPTSAAVNLYAWPVAPTISTQPA